MTEQARKKCKPHDFMFALGATRNCEIVEWRKKKKKHTRIVYIEQIDVVEAQQGRKSFGL